MKKNLKKLSLNRETLRGLEAQEAAEALGGAVRTTTFSYTVVKEDCCVL